MNIETLKIFTEVAKQGSFAGSARALSLDPSLVSRAIASLEDELGMRLFQRTTRHMTLTEAGQTYFESVEPILADLEAARDKALALSSQPSGLLRVTSSVAFGQIKLLPLLEIFQADFPKLTLELIMTDEPLDLITQRIDIAIRLAPIIQEDAICRKLFNTRYKVYASPDYIATHSPITTPESLADHNALLMTFELYRSPWLFRNHNNQIKEIPVKGTLIMSNAIALREAMLSGLGPALLPDWLIDDALKNGKCVDLLPDYQAAYTSFETAAWLLYPSRNFLPHKSRLVLDFLKHHLT